MKATLPGCSFRLCLVLVASTPAVALESIRLEERAGGARVFVDSLGRERIFHGTNAIAKGPPWVPDSRSFSNDISMSAEDFVWMQKLGLNLLRLGVMWPGYEPERGSYNETYLDEVDRIVRLAADHGIYTLLDMHQDGFSEHFCGEGFPSWAVKRAKGTLLSKAFPEPFDHLDNKTDYYVEARLGGSPRIPTRKACHTHNIGPGWHEVDQESSQAYQALWDNWEGIGDAWAAMWARVARKFKGRPEILGLELINEPFNGDFYHDPPIIVPPPNPHNADKLNLQPAYDRVSAAVRAVDDNVLIFFAGVTSDNFGPGFTAAPGGAQYANRSVLAYHFYKPPQTSAKDQVHNNLAAARRLGTGAMLTETSDGDGLMEIKEAADAADVGLQSWAGWEWKNFFREGEGLVPIESQLAAWGANKTGVGPLWQNGAPDVSFQRDNARTFASAVAGDIVEMYFDTKYASFHLQYKTKEGVDMQVPTEIFLWPERYPGGALVEASASAGSVRVEYAGAGSSAVRVYPAEKLTAGTLIRVSIWEATAPTPSPPHSPCMYVVPFNFSKDVDSHAQLPDGDTILMRKSPAAKSSSAVVQVRLTDEADTWWKAITQHHDNKFVREVAATQDKRTEATGQIQVADLLHGDHFVLSKAKTLGVHTNVYCIAGAGYMEPAMIYTFDWKACASPVDVTELVI
eukprot:TRINITY_DN15012_c0_g1_i2.p1 TRINITY_DN15012_c0_g1~~TRINITY_DN15012_c0_g1_i2.p1  ORF type:complete len:685 (+),score=124.34 TRINITY_DN15012_c0_g1_i2:75-2129(+)